MATSTKSEDLNSLSTFDLAFNLARGLYSETEKLDVLSIIKNREEGTETKVIQLSNSKKQLKKPLPGSKAEKIQNLLIAGNKPLEVGKILKKQKITAYPAEIYRIKKMIDESK